jgi:predicted AAA+ superfamily ATPase
MGLNSTITPLNIGIMLIQRKVKSELLALLKEYPVVTLLGPRQAGKTTLAKTALPDYACQRRFKSGVKVAV